MNIIVQKYGGTSLREISNKSKFLFHIRECINKGNKLVVVVSAIGRKGEAYATDTLIEQLEKISSKINPKKKDLIMSCGEIISAATIGHLLDSENIPCEVLTGYQAGILTDDNFTKSKILNIDTSIINKYLNQNKVVVVAGFQGKTIKDEITTLGRGGSDTTAVALGSYLKADRVDIFTEVEGVAFIDPNLIKNPKYIKEISYDDMYKLAINGVSVLHPRAVMIGKEYDTKIQIRSTNLKKKGTIVTNLDNQKTNKVLGIAIKNENNKTIISVLFNNIYRDTIIKKASEYINKEYKKSQRNIDVIYDQDKVSFIIDCNQLYYHINKLYNLFSN